MERKRCPICHNFLQEVEAQNKYGLKTRIDICPSGCGFWFDQFEIYQIGFSIAEKLASQIPSKPQEENKQISCPVCQIPMIKVKPDYFSEEIIFDYCKSCSGIWITKEMLVKYKSLQEEKGRKAFLELLREGENSSKEEPGENFIDFLVKLFQSRLL